MSKQSHTPGPWKFTASIYGMPSILASDNSAWVAERVYNGNEHLIAAAPDLLAACQKAVDVLEPFNFEGTWDDALEPLKAALAKAKGATP